MLELHQLQLLEGDTAKPQSAMYLFIFRRKNYRLSALRTNLCEELCQIEVNGGRVPRRMFRQFEQWPLPIGTCCVKSRFVPSCHYHIHDTLATMKLQRHFDISVDEECQPLF